jgi:hypothetical protein
MSIKFDNYGRPGVFQKKWVRILISFFAGSCLTELIFISTGDPNRQRTEINYIVPIFFAIGIYFLFTYILTKMGKIK